MSLFGGNAIMTDKETQVIAAARAVVKARQARYAMDLTFRKGVAVDPDRAVEWQRAMVECTSEILRLDEILRQAVEALPE
jgi:hypothetical protein